MPQLPFSLGPDGICGCLLEDQFAVWKILVVQWQILQFIPEHPHVFFLVMMDGIQCGGIALSPTGSQALALSMDAWLVDNGWFSGGIGGMSGCVQAVPRMRTSVMTKSFWRICL